ncbi:unnamed protein product, partial [Phaeothamnion confervicola]
MTWDMEAFAPGVCSSFFSSLSNALGQLTICFVWVSVFGRTCMSHFEFETTGESVPISSETIAPECRLMFTCALCPSVHKPEPPFLLSRNSRRPAGLPHSRER